MYGYITLAIQVVYWDEALAAEADTLQCIDTPSVVHHTAQLAMVRTGQQVQRARASRSIISTACRQHQQWSHWQCTWRCQRRLYVHAAHRTDNIRINVSLLPACKLSTWQFIGDELLSLMEYSGSSLCLAPEEHSDTPLVIKEATS